MITSRSNPAVKRFRALRHRKDRDETSLFFIEGIRIVGEAMELGAKVETLVVAPDLLTSQYARDLLNSVADGIDVLEVSPEVFRTLSIKDGPQGIGAVVRQQWVTLDEIDPAEDFCWVALDAVGDPGNLGTIVRTSDAVGGSGVILIGPSTDPYDVTALRASMGAAISQKHVRADFDSLFEWTHRHGCMVIGTSDTASADYQSVRYRWPLVLLMGSEREGLPEERQTQCDVTVSIPMAGRSDSLNLAVAAGVVLYEAFNQRRTVHE